ncbi:MAG: hypothetical protein IKZ29_01745 [Clostridiales bacterium]|nr:hypothetical protein [Clostridiales bacterium]
MVFVIYGGLIAITIFAFKHKMWFLGGFCCFLMLLGFALFACVVHEMQHLAN